MESKLNSVLGKKSCCCDEYRNLERFIYKWDEFFNNAYEKVIQGIKKVRELINDDNTSLTFYLEVEKSITKVTSKEKFTATLEKDKTKEEQSRNATTQEISKKSKLKIPYAKKEKQDCSAQIPYTRESSSKVEI